ncbi:hypothetical protein HZ994_18095 [Akkermansiaceae bacterium]|nr:hypothetical protein HZ994_18095 [Akkermansiaceae bacterium]
MQILNRVNFEIPIPEGSAAEDVFSACGSEVLKWVATRQFITKPQAVPRTLETVPRIAVAKTSTIETVKASHAGAQAWGVKIRNPDTSNRYLIWSSEVTLLQTPAGQLFFSCSLLIHREGRFIAPVNRKPNTPGIVRRILDQFGGKASYPLSSSPLRFRNSGKDVATLIRVLESTDRTHPIILVTPRTADGSYTTDPDELAKFLAGMAHVIVAEDVDATRHLESSLPRHLNCFDGGTRIYWPGFRRHSPPDYHPLFLRYQIEKWNRTDPHLVGQELHSMIAETAAYSIHESFLTWPALERLARQEAISKAKESGETDEYLELLEEENRDLTAETATLNTALEEARSDAARQKHLVGQLQQALADRKSGQVGATEAELPVQSVPEAIERAESEYSDKLAFQFNSKSEEKVSPFNHPEEVLQAFRWLATTYHDAKSGKQPNSDLEGDFAEHVPGWNFRTHQKKETMRNAKWRPYYVCTHDSREIELPAHFKCGTSSDPRETIRIAFNWDGATGKVVVGFLGQHQPNTKTA